MSPDSNDYRLFIDEKFIGLTKLMDAEFTNIHDKFSEQVSVLKEIKEQTTRTNGRVTDLEKFKGQALEVHKFRERQISDIEDRMNKSCDKMEGAVSDLNKLKANIEGERGAGINLRSNLTLIIMFLGIIVTIIIGVVNMRHNKNLKTEVDMINTPVRNSRGEIIMLPSGVIIDSLKSVTPNMK